MNHRVSEIISYRLSSEVPFFCKPVPLFLAIWLMMLATFYMHLTYNSYPDGTLPLLLFALSFSSLIVGLFVARLFAAYRTAPARPVLSYRIDLTLLRRVQLVLFAVSLLIFIANFAAYGFPPLFSMLGATTLNYIEYGKLKQVLNAATMALTVCVSIEPSRKRKYLAYGFSFFAMLAYATRGFLLVMLAQALFVFCLKTKVSKRTLYGVAIATFFAAALITNFIGNGRSDSTQEAFVAFFGIRNQYAQWPMTTLWLLSYIATPFSNLCWIVHSYHYTHPSLIFLATLLPAFWMPHLLDTEFLGTSAIIDGVHTYAAKYYLDLWYFGIFLINFVWGIISGILNGRRLVRHALTSAVFLAAIVFLFFADYITMLSIVIELSVLAWIERYAILPVVSLVDDTQAMPS